MKYGWCMVLVVGIALMVSETVFSAQQQSTIQFQKFLNHRSYKAVMKSVATDKNNPELDKTASHCAVESYRRALESYRRALQFDEQEKGTRFPEILRQLREAGADARVVDCQGQTVLHRACLWKLNEIIHEILADESFDQSVLNQQDNFWRTPLHCALEIDVSSQAVIFLGHELIRKLMTKQNVNMCDAMGNLPIVHVLKDSKLVDMFFELGYAVPTVSDDNMNIFHHAAYKSAPGVITALWKACPDADRAAMLQQLFVGKAPLHEAASRLRHDAIKELIGCGAPINQVNGVGQTALLIYLQNLIEDLNSQSPISVDSQKVLETVQSLAGSKSELIKNNDDSLSPYHVVAVALEENNQHALLLKIKAYFDGVVNPSAIPPSGQAPVMVESNSESVKKMLNTIAGATSRNSEYIVTKLNSLFNKEQPVNLNFNFSDGNDVTTPLIKLVRILKDLEIDCRVAVQLFIDKGAPVLSRDSNNKLALDYALESPLVECSKVLINKMEEKCFEGGPAPVEILFKMISQKFQAVSSRWNKKTMDDVIKKYNSIMQTMLEKIANTKKQQEQAIDTCWKKIVEDVEALPAEQVLPERVTELVNLANQQLAAVRKVLSE